MKAVRRGIGLLCLVAALCLAPGIWRSALLAEAESCGNLIRDGGFETGGAWQLGVTPVPPEYVTSVKHSGSRSLLLGIAEGANTASYSSASQSVIIPADAAESRLSFWRSTTSGDQAGADKMQLVLLNPDGSTLAVLWTSTDHSPSWSQLSFDVTPWRGRTVQVYFNVINDGSGAVTGMYLDDVELAACPDSASTAAASPPAPSEAVAAPTTPPMASLEDPLETPPIVFFTPAGDQAFAQTDSETPALDGNAGLSPATPPGSGTPALIFFTPTAGANLAGTGAGTPQIDSGTPGSAREDGSAVPALQVTRVALPVTPGASLMPAVARETVAARAALRTPTPRDPGEARFAQWPKGWWFVVAAVIAIILAAGLFAWRPA